MREILFRGKTKFGKWVYWDAFGLMADEDGNPKVYYFDMPHVIHVDTALRYIDHETIGQFTGMFDEDGKRIFEGDIVTGLFLLGLSINSVVRFKDGTFGLEWHRGDIKTFDGFTNICNVKYKVIGNVYDNPELLQR
jgi:uncharacterized phage protein (TIGR01671 family)